jgi:hypothetical protein
MAGQATTAPLRDGQLDSGHELRLRLGRLRDRAPAASGRLAGAVSLWAIVALSLLLVIAAAARPSLLSPPTHFGFYPHWMAGPLGGLWSGLTQNSTALRWLFTAPLILMYGAYVVVLRRSKHLPASWILGGILAVHAVFILSPPLPLTDVFNYINYGRMEVVHNLNPYTSIPILEPHNDPSYALSRWHQLYSPYGPLFTMVTFLVVPLGVAASFWTLKVLLVLTSLAMLTLVWHCARLLDRDPVKAVAVVGLNPIVLVWGLGGDHNDFLMVFFLMLGFYLLLLARSRRRRRPLPSGGGRFEHLLLPLSAPLLGAGVAFVVAVGIKASAAVLIPVILAGLLREPRGLVQVLIGMAISSVLVGVLSLMAFGLHIPDLSTQSDLVTNESVPNLIGLAIGQGGEGQTLHDVLTGVLALSILSCCWWAWRGARPGRPAASVEDAPDRTIAASGWASVALLVTLSWVLPWYVLWVLPMAALSNSRRLRNTALVLGVYLIVAWAPASGLLWSAIGFHPENTPLGRLHARYVSELLN